MSAVLAAVDPPDDAAEALVYRIGPNYIGVTIGAFRVLFRGDSLDQSVDLAESVLRKALQAIQESWPQ